METLIFSIVVGAGIWMLIRHPILSLSIISQIAFIGVIGGAVLIYIVWSLIQT